LTWLEDNHIRLADATQHDVSTWVGQGASTRHRLRDFLRCSHAGGFAADLEVRWLGSEGLPGHILDDDERWALLWRCLRDDSLSLRLRVAGALVLLYGRFPRGLSIHHWQHHHEQDQIPTSPCATTPCFSHRRLPR
jgi:hypothetical protein